MKMSDLQRENLFRRKAGKDDSTMMGFKLSFTLDLLQLCSLAVSWPISLFPKTIMNFENPKLSLPSTTTPCAPTILRSMLLNNQWTCHKDTEGFIGVITNVVGDIMKWWDHNWSQCLVIALFVVMFFVTLFGSVLLYQLIDQCQNNADEFDEEDELTFRESRFVYVSDGHELAAMTRGQTYNSIND